MSKTSKAVDVEFVSTDQAPRAKGHYAQAVLANGFVFVSGQLPFEVNGEPLREATPSEQVRRCLENLDAILIASGSCRERVVRVSLYVSDIKFWPAINVEYARFFGDHKPARTVVPSQKLHYGFDVELDAVALFGRDAEKIGVLRPQEDGD